MLAERQNGIISEYIERFEKGAEELDADAAEKLNAFLKSIMDPEARYCMDAAIGMRLCRLLYAYYHAAADMEKAVYVIKCGATCEIMLSLELEEHDFLQFPQLCEEYLPQTENRPFVDILAIADSLDAATDFIGRPYGKGKTLDDLIGEFLEMGGTRYSREVAEILNEPEVKAAVLDMITRRREEVNYQIYALGTIEK